MANFRKIAFSVFVLAATLLAVPLARADQIQTLNFSGTPNFLTPLTFDLYSGTGTLDEVWLHINYQITGGSLEVDNDAAAPATVNVQLGADGQLSTSNSAMLLDSSFAAIFNSVLVQNTATFNLTANDGDASGFQSGGTDYAILNGSTLSTSGDKQVNSAFTNLYVASGGNTTVTYNLDFSQVLDFGGVGGVAGSFTPLSVDGTLVLEYKTHGDTPPPSGTPEPTTMLLMGSSLLGVIAWRRRKRQDS